MKHQVQRVVGRDDAEAAVDDGAIAGTLPVEIFDQLLNDVGAAVVALPPRAV